MNPQSSDAFSPNKDSPSTSRKRPGDSDNTFKTTGPIVANHRLAPINKENIIQNSRMFKQTSVQNSKNKFITLELNTLRVYSFFYGIYCVPQPFKPEVWDGIIFIRSGLYKPGKFKFHINFPDGYPRVCPDVFFDAKVYHPLIDPESGKVDLKYLNPSWKTDSTISHNLLKWLKSIFHEAPYLEITDSFNPEAGKLFKEDVEAFYQKVVDSIGDAEKVLYEKNPNNGLNFSSEYTSQHEKMRETLKKITADKELSDQAKVKSFVDSLIKEARNKVK